ncbi:MAG: shikimate kinase [Candidatus Omnitrophica bacterium]|nr:shikimate kinase [Candidatus Omnitrophota bacterium]
MLGISRRGWVKNIVLIGFMGTGKSVLGKRLAKLLKMPFISTDDIIEQKEGRTISEIFGSLGEQYFRDAEKEAVKGASAMEGVVIAAGGGAVLNEENITNLKKNGVMFCLTASAQDIYERTKNYKHRPLLNVADPVTRIKELLAERSMFYAKANFQIDTTGKSVEEVTHEIIKWLKKV